MYISQIFYFIIFTARNVSGTHTYSKILNLSLYQHYQLVKVVHWNLYYISSLYGDEMPIT